MNDNHINVFPGLTSPPEVVAAREGSNFALDDNKEKNTATVQLFFSFDIVNSTKYKEIVGSWPIIIKGLVNEIKKRVFRSNYLGNSYLWRVIGDEIIFVLPIYVKKNLIDAVNSIFEETQNIAISLKNGKFFDTLNDQCITKQDVKMLKAQGILSVKSAAWIAAVNTNIANRHDNIITTYDSESQKEKIREYLGPDIDAGFRLKIYTQDRRLAISYDLAYFLNQLNEQKHLHIMDYVILKGVWNDSLYPVIWYYNEETYQKLSANSEREWIQFLDSFRYDENQDNAIVRNFMMRKFEKENPTVVSGIKLNPKMYEISEAVKKIALDRNLEDKFAYMESLFKDEEQVPRSSTIEAPLELHCAVVCCDVLNRSVMIAKRGTNHRSNNQKWEFGCIKAEGSTALIKTIEKGYETEFGIKVKLILDHKRQDKQPRPLAVYEISSLDNFRKGIIFVGKASCSSEFRSNDSHTQIRWIKESEVDQYQGSDVIPDFHDTLHKVFAHWDEYVTEGE